MLDLQVLKGKEEDQEEMVNEDCLVQLVPKENLDYKAFLEFLVRREIEDIRVMLDLKVTREPRE